MTVSAIASGATTLNHSSLNSQRLTPVNKRKSSIKFLIDIRNRSSSSSSRLESSFPIRAIDSQREEENPSLQDSNSNSNGNLFPKEDLKYLWKLVAGSFVGAAIIKYGSVFFPEITRPNLLQALIMVSSPAIIATFLLIKKSSRTRTY